MESEDVVGDHTSQYHPLAQASQPESSGILYILEEFNLYLTCSRNCPKQRQHINQNSNAEALGSTLSGRSSGRGRCVGFVGDEPTASSGDVCRNARGISSLQGFLQTSGPLFSRRCSPCADVSKAQLRGSTCAQVVG